MIIEEAYKLSHEIAERIVASALQAWHRVLGRVMRRSKPVAVRVNADGTRPSSTAQLGIDP